VLGSAHWHNVIAGHRRRLETLAVSLRHAVGVGRLSYFTPYWSTPGLKGIPYSFDAHPCAVVRASYVRGDPDGREGLRVYDLMRGLGLTRQRVSNLRKVTKL
jgi:hypothetical protein